MAQDNPNLKGSGIDIFTHQQLRFGTAADSYLLSSHLYRSLHMLSCSSHIELRWIISNCTLGLQQVHTCCPVSCTRVCICCHAQTTSSLEGSSAIVLCLVLLLQILVRLPGFCAMAQDNPNLKG